LQNPAGIAAALCVSDKRKEAEMAMVLTLVGISLILTVVIAVLLSAAMRPAETSPVVRKNPHLNVTRHFFESDMPLSVPGEPASAVPIDALLLELERHVRLERAVAESFHLSPTPQSLHVHTASQLMH
jgi:hypothetical protein